MKSFILAALSLLALVNAQDLSQLPACATSCAASAIGATGCAVTDAHCVCSNTAFLNSVQTCIATACSPADQQKTLQFAQTYCLSGNVTITLPTASGTIPPASSAAPASTSAAISSAPATTFVSTTAVASTPVSSVSQVSQISDGQPQGPTSAAPATFTGAAVSGAANWAVEAFGLGMGMIAAL